MKMFKKVSKALAVLLSLLIVLTACGSSQSTSSGSTAQSSDTRTSDDKPAGEPQKGGTLKVTISADPGSMDMHLDGAENAQIPGSHIFETLLVADLKGNPHPLLCDYKVSEDGKAITLTMRENVKFHNGDIMDIEDIKASINRWLKNVSFAQKTVGSKLESLEYPDSKTIVFTFKEAAPLALTALSAYDQGPYVMPKEILEAAGDNKITEYIGTGPYKFVEWKADRHIKLARFEDYQPVENMANGLAAPKRAYADEIYVIPVKDKMTRITGVQTGDYDVGIGVPFNMYETLKSDPNLNVVMQDLGIFASMVFNYKEGPTADVKLRQAILACLDMNDIMLAAEGDPDFYYLHPCWMPKSSAFNNDEGSDRYNHPDIELAKKLISESSYKGETLVYLTTKDYDYFYKTALIVSDMIRKAGINVELQVVDNATLNELRKDSSKYAMFSSGLTAKTDPTLIAFMADGWAGFYQSEKKAQLLNEMLSEFDPNKRIKTWAQFSGTLYEEVPAITFGERKVATVTNRKVQNLFEGTTKYYWNTWISK